MSALHRDLIKAYEGTEFRVLEPKFFTLRIGIHSEELAALYSDLNVTSAGFLTAWNPFGVETSAAENRLAQLELVRTLSHVGLPTFKAFGVDPSSTWPGEDSVFIPGLEFKMAKAVGTKFRQNVIVWAGTNALPQLVLLRYIAMRTLVVHVPDPSVDIPDDVWSEFLPQRRPLRLRLWHRLIFTPVKWRGRLGLVHWELLQSYQEFWFMLDDKMRSAMDRVKQWAKRYFNLQIVEFGHSVLRRYPFLKVSSRKQVVPNK